MGKKCTLAIGRSVYVRKECQGMTLTAADTIMCRLSVEAHARLQEYLPDGISLEKPSKPRLLNHGIVESGISATKDGKHCPAYHWLLDTGIRELEKEYHINIQ